MYSTVQHRPHQFGINRDRNYFSMRPDESNDNSIPHPSQQFRDEHNTLVIDSRTRNFTLYPDANNYSIDVNTHMTGSNYEYNTLDFENIVSIELQAASIPKTEYNIHSGNNKVDFTMTGSGLSYTATIPSRQYTASTLFYTTASYMNAQFDNTFVVTASLGGIPLLEGGTYNNVQFDGDNAFTLDWNSGINKRSSMRTALGFPPTDTTSVTRVMGSYGYNLQDDPKYVILSFSTENDIERIKSPANTIDRAFAVLPFDGNKTDVLFPNPDGLTGINGGETGNNPQQVPGIVKPIKLSDADRKSLVFNPPRRINRLDFRFKKYNGDFYDFHGREHVLIFDITTRKGNNV